VNDKIEEAKARLAAVRQEQIKDPCPKCEKDTCTCYVSGEFWETQKRLRTTDTEIKRLGDQLAAATAALAERDAVITEMRAVVDGATAWRAARQRLREANIAALEDLDHGAYATDEQDEAIHAVGLAEAESRRCSGRPRPRPHRRRQGGGVSDKCTYPEHLPTAPPPPGHWKWTCPACGEITDGKAILELRDIIVKDALRHHRGMCPSRGGEFAPALSRCRDISC